MMNCIKYSLILLLLFFISCESMEDTYDQYTKDGKTRYVGKISEFKLQEGWKRFILEWNNSEDNTVKSILLKWTDSKESDSIVLPKDYTTFETPQNFQDRIYTFSIYSLDQYNNKSIKATITGRPYTETHEDIKTFKNLEDKFFYLGDELIIFFADDNSDIINPRINYFKNGEAVSEDITPEILEAKVMCIPGIDSDKDVMITRSANVEGCADVIDFEPYVLDRTQFTLKADFSGMLKRENDLENISTAFINSTETLFIDGDLISLEDVLRFPKLKKIVIGGHTYFHNDYLTDKTSTLIDKNTSVYALNKLIEKRDVVVEIYNDTYGIAEELELTSLGNPAIPDLNLLDSENWTVECNTIEMGDHSHPEYILDDDASTTWKPLPKEIYGRKHELTIDMKESTKINGFLVRQPIGEDIFTDHFSNTIIVKVSDDGEVWRDIFINPVLHIGTARGQSTIINLSESQSCRYVRIFINDKTGNRKLTYLADFLLF